MNENRGKTNGIGPSLTIEDLGERRRISVEGRHSRLGQWVTSSVMETSYSLELVEAIYKIKGEWTCNEIERSEAPSCCEEMLAGVHRYEIDIAGKRVLEFGCGAGASALILLRDASPPRSFVGVDINESLLAIARMRLAEFGFSEVSEFRAISQNDPLGFIDDESLDVVVASEVFEHIDPKDRQKIVNILWSKLAKGGLLYVTAPSRLSPIDMHTTGLWFTYWLPLGIACDYARLFSRRCRGRTNDQLVADGIRGFSYFELKSLLGSRSFIDMSAVLPLSSPPDERTGPKVLWTKLMWPIYQAVLHRFAPYDAFAPRCVLCFRRE